MITMHDLTRLFGLTVSILAWALAAAISPVSVLAGSPLDLQLTGFAGPTTIPSGSTVTYTFTVHNPNTDYDGGMDLAISTSGSVAPADVVNSSAGTLCGELPPFFDQATGMVRCVAPSLKATGTTTVSVAIQATRLGGGDVRIFLASLDSNPILIAPTRTIAVNVAEAGLTAPTLSRGDDGDSVKTVQTLLNHHGANIEEDGDFGSQTEAAVRDFQKAKGLGVDGTVDLETWAALFVTVRSGDKSDAVRAVQDQLAARGVDINSDGNFGSKTDAAVRDFQKAKGLSVDGIVGSRTWSALVSAK